MPTDRFPYLIHRYEFLLQQSTIRKATVASFSKSLASLSRLDTRFQTSTEWQNGSHALELGRWLSCLTTSSTTSSLQVGRLKLSPPGSVCWNCSRSVASNFTPGRVRPPPQSHRFWAWLSTLLLCEVRNASWFKHARDELATSTSSSSYTPSSKRVSQPPVKLGAVLGSSVSSAVPCLGRWTNVAPRNTCQAISTSLDHNERASLDLPRTDDLLPTFFATSNSHNQSERHPCCCTRTLPMSRKDRAAGGFLEQFSFTEQLGSTWSSPLGQSQRQLFLPGLLSGITGLDPQPAFWTSTSTESSPSPTFQMAQVVMTLLS